MLGTIASNLRVKKGQTWFVSLLIISLLLVYAVRDIARNRNWTNAYTLYAHDIKFDPNNYELQSGFGIELYNRGDYEAAKNHLLYSIKLYPNNQNLTALAFTYQRLGKISEAHDTLLKALSYKDDPNTYQGLIKLMLVNYKPQETAIFIQKELKKHPNDPVLWLYLSVEDYKLGKISNALDEVQKSYKLFPSQEARYVFQQITNNKPIKLINQ
jgi:tetratricopeptide (TPR) repeat protein